MHKIDLDDPKGSDYRVEEMARVLGVLCSTWLSEQDSMTCPSYAELGVRIAGLLRAEGLPAGTQMAGLLYLAHCAYVPQVLVGLKMTKHAERYFEWVRTVSGPVQRAIMRKYGADMEYNSRVVQVVQGVVDDASPRRLGAEAASLAFEVCMVTLATEIHPRIETCVRMETSQAFRCVEWAANAVKAPTPSTVGSIEALVTDLRNVFLAHGFKPESPALEALINMLDGAAPPSSPSGSN